MVQGTGRGCGSLKFALIRRQSAAANLRHAYPDGISESAVKNGKGPRKNNFALSGGFFWPRASLFAPYRPAGGVCASLTPRRRPKLLRRKIRIYFCAAPNRSRSCRQARITAVLNSPNGGNPLWCRFPAGCSRPFVNGYTVMEYASPNCYLNFPLAIIKTLIFGLFTVIYLLHFPSKLCFFGLVCKTNGKLSYESNMDSSHCSRDRSRNARSSSDISPATIFSSGKLRFKR